MSFQLLLIICDNSVRELPNFSVSKKMKSDIDYMLRIPSESEAQKEDTVTSATYVKQTENASMELQLK